MLIINEQDIAKAVESYELVSAIEKAYIIQNKKTTNIPNRLHINNDQNTLLVMPGFINTVFGTKLVSVFPENEQKNKTTLNGIMILNDGETGEPIALINGNKLTAMRTAAVGATAVKYLAPFSAQSLGIIGAGIQAYHQALIVSQQRPFLRLYLCDKNLSKAEVVKEELDYRLPNVDIVVTDNSDQLVLDSDVIVTATTSKQPVFNIESKHLKNKTFIGIGSYKMDMQEIPLSVYEKIDKVYVDTLYSKEECGDIKVPLEKGLIKEEDIVSFSHLLASGDFMKQNSVNLFKSVGMSLFDLTVAELIYENVREKNLGIEVKI